ncbi:MAG TPA: penicillin-binding protein [Candidatus Angelobacter sp.]|nr:penicillin-binding protein [Candidatus Sulfotelmatobacter sp.]HET9838819.1 penicillin-binding protein [Candidatus Angelobacter sp.]
MAQRNANTNKRLFILAGFFAFWFLAICGRLVWLQVVDYGEYTQRAVRQQQRSIDVSPVRGNIYDRRGNELAMTVQVDSVFAVPSEIPDIHSDAQILGRILKADPGDLEDRMRASHAFAWVARKVDNATAARIRALNLKGIYFQKEAKRFYPKGELAAQVLGYVGLDDKGLGGIETEFESKLTGKPGKMLITMDNRRRWLGRVEKNPEPGENVVLTIDEKIQYIAERALAQAMDETHAEAGTVIVENPHTGEILALANSPTFNPNISSKINAQSLKNRAVSDIYEPGSTFKVVTLAAALEEKITNPDEVVDCQMGSIVVNGLRIHDHKAYGGLTVTQILEKSSDVGAIKLALRLGEDRFDRYIRGFGFGSQTRIELPGETRGMTKPVSRWSKVSIGAISMGQEIGVSPVQLASMVSTIANDGVYVAPRIVAGTTPPRSTPQLIEFHPPLGRRVISPFTAAEMKRMMEGVVLRGTGPKAILDGYTSAGKTGTAQKIDATGHYSHRQHIASFAGFAPVNNPAVTVLVVLDTPATYPHDQGGDVAAPVFARVAQQVLAYLNVPHDVDLRDPKHLWARTHAKDADHSEGAPDYIAGQQESADASATAPASSPAALPLKNAEVKTVEAASKPVSPPPAPVNSIPSAATATQQASAKTPEQPHGTVVLDVAGGVLVPDFKGKSLRAALEQAEEAGLELEITGSGTGQEQNPAAGSRVPPGGHVSVRFSR